MCCSVCGCTCVACVVFVWCVGVVLFGGMRHFVSCLGPRGVSGVPS